MMMVIHHHHHTTQTHTHTQTTYTSPCTMTSDILKTVVQELYLNHVDYMNNLFGVSYRHIEWLLVYFVAVFSIRTFILSTPAGFVLQKCETFFIVLVEVLVLLLLFMFFKPQAVSS